MYVRVCIYVYCIVVLCLFSVNSSNELILLVRRKLKLIVLCLWCYRAWCSEMMAIITSDDLAKDVAGTETMISRHKEHRAEIDTRLKDFTKFTQTGQALIADGHFLSDEVGCEYEQVYFRNKTHIHASVHDILYVTRIVNKNTVIRFKDHKKSCKKTLK